MELNTEYLPQSIIIYVLIVGAFWTLPKMVGVAEWDLMTRIMITVVTAPLCYFIVPYMAEK